MSKIDLAKIIFDRIEALGEVKAAAFFGKTKTAINKWQAGTAQPDVSAAQKVLDELLDGGTVEVPVFSESPEQGATKPEPAPVLVEKPTAVSDGEADEKRMTVAPVKAVERAKKFHILMPINRDIPYATVLSLLGQWKATLPPEVREMLAKVHMEPDTTAVFARNRLATDFLNSKAEISVWMDSDMIAGVGNPGWFRRRTGANYPDKFLEVAAIEQLARRNKTIVGGVYAERSDGRKLLLHPALKEDEKTLAEEIRKGPSDRLVEVTWIGFGFVMVHRRVFEDILAKVPGVKSKDANQPHEFFTPWKGGTQGEDMAFCERAKQAGHATYADLSVYCAHLGRKSFLPV